MAISATTHIAHDGERHVLMQLVGVGNGTDQETNELKVDVSALAPVPTSVKIREIEYAILGPGTVTLSWEATPSPVPFATLQGQGEFDYCKIEGLPNLAADKTGNILLSTTDFESTSAYTISLSMIKKF